jgi:hypothetical protein
VVDCHKTKGDKPRQTGTISAVGIGKTHIMEENASNNIDSKLPEKELRPMEYDEANDRLTNMTDLQKLMAKLELQGFKDQFRVEKGRLIDLSTKKSYKPKDVKAVNFFRFEGISNPDDMSILYAIETSDGSKGTLTDSYGMYADEDTSAFMQEVEIHKKVTKS